MNTIRRVVQNLFCILILFSGVVLAESNETVKLQDLIKELKELNPEIQAARLRYQSSLTRAPQEKALPDPRVNFGWMSAGTILPGGKLGEDPNANIGFQVSQEFPYPGKRGLRAEAANQEASSVQHMQEAVERKNVARLKTAYYELCYVYQALDLLQENRLSLQRLSKVAEARYSVGKATQQDLIKSETEVAILQNKELVLEQKKQALTAEINALLNRPADSTLGRPEAGEPPALPSYSLLLDQVRKNSPMLLSQTRMIQSRETGIQLAKKDFYPDFEVMTGYYHQGELDDMWEVRAGISIPVFYRSKQRKQLEEATLQLNEARQNEKATEQMLEYKLRDAYLKAETSRKLMDLYEKQIVPQSKLALESSLASYETGNVDFLTVFSNFNTIYEYQTSYQEQLSEYFKAVALLEELAGDTTSEEAGS